MPFPLPPSRRAQALRPEYVVPTLWTALTLAIPAPRYHPISRLHPLARRVYRACGHLNRRQLLRRSGDRLHFTVGNIQCPPLPKSPGRGRRRALLLGELPHFHQTSRRVAPSHPRRHPQRPL